MKEFSSLTGCLRSFPARRWKNRLAKALVFSVLALASAEAQVATPVLNPPSGTLSTLTNVQVTCSTSGAELHYTTDGSAPALASPLVPASGLIPVGRNLTLKVSAWSGTTSSSVAQGSYVVPGSLVCGMNFSLAVRFDGRKVWAWGNNSYGQLGDGTLTNSLIPVQVRNSTVVGDYLQDVRMIAGGQSHALALKTDGTVWSWGGNSNGQLGNGTTANQLYPSPMLNTAQAGLTGMTQIAAGYEFSLALRGSDGSVWACGRNAYGVIGVTGTAPVPLARQIKANSTTNFTGVASIAAGTYSAMALKTDGTVWVWGLNGNGQFGNAANTVASSIYPVKVASLSGITAISMGNGSCYALGSDGTLWAWGLNDAGQLGNGSTSNGVFTPARVKTSASVNLTGIVAVAAGYHHLLALASNGQIWACGYGNFGQLAYNGSHSSSSYAILVRSGLVNGQQAVFSGAISMSAGQNQSAALKSDGTAYLWGDGSAGQVGNNSTAQQVYPVNIITGIFPELGNHSPTINLAISDGPYYQTGTITLTGNPWDTDAVSGTSSGLGSVNFYDGTTFLGGTTSYPWSFQLNSPLLGNHSFSAQVVDEVGATSNSSSIPVSISYDPSLDTDGDGIPDVWEMAQSFNMSDPSDATADSDGDGLNNLQEYLLGLNPHNPDANSNGVLDGMDDSNSDGIPDSYEYQSGDPTVPFAPTFIVNGEGGGDFRDLQSAINAVTADYQSIQVEDGTYSGLFAISGYKILLYSKNGASKTILALNGESAGLYVATDSLIRGFGIRDGSGDRNSINGTGGNVFIDAASPKFERCVISQGLADDGSALINNYGHPVLVNCTITNNQATNSAIYSWGYPVTLNNCILWNPDCPVETGGVGIIAHKSIVRGGGTGDNLDLDPLIGMGGHLLVGSPAIDAAASDASTVPDMDGEGAQNQRDIGADEYWDSDGDGMPDWWEKLNADAGLNFNDPSDATSDPDEDTVTMLDDYHASSQGSN